MKKTYKIIMISLIAVIVLGIGIVVGNSWHTKTQQPKVSTTTITNNTAKGEASKEEKEALKSSEQALSEATKKVVDSAIKKEEPATPQQTNQPQQKQETQQPQTQQAPTPAPVKQAIPTNNKVVCIDAGHQRYGNSAKEPIGPGATQTKAKVTTGATGIRSHRTESQINLEIALKLQRILQSRGYTVVMCRTSQDVNLSNKERADIANKAHAGAFIRLHCDSSDNQSVNGVTGLAPASGNPYLSSSIVSSSQSLTRAVVNGLCSATGAKNRGLSLVNNMSGINWTQVPVALVEMGFISNPNEDANLTNDAYQEKVANGIANGIASFLH